MVLGPPARSVPRQLELVRRNPDRFRVVGVAAGGAPAQDLQLAFSATAQRQGFSTGGGLVAGGRLVQAARTRPDQRARSSPSTARPWSTRRWGPSRRTGSSICRTTRSTSSSTRNRLCTRWSSLSTARPSRRRPRHPWASRSRWGCPGRTGCSVLRPAATGRRPRRGSSRPGRRGRPGPYACPRRRGNRAVRDRCLQRGQRGLRRGAPGRAVGVSPHPGRVEQVLSEPETAPITSVAEAAGVKHLARRRAAEIVGTEGLCRHGDLRCRHSGVGGATRGPGIC